MEEPDPEPTTPENTVDGGNNVVTPPSTTNTTTTNTVVQSRSTAVNINGEIN